MNSELTQYEKWQKLESAEEKMRFFFKNTIRYKNCKIRYSTKQNGFYVTEQFGKKYFAEYSKVSSEFIHLFLVENGNIKQCCKEIVLDNFLENLKENHNFSKSVDEICNNRK